MPIMFSSKYQNQVSNIEIKLRYGCGIFLAIISTILTISLFLNLAGNNLIRQIVMTFLALGLETSKVLNFRLKQGYRVISISLIIISIIASFGSALVVVEENKVSLLKISQVKNHNSDIYKNTIDEIASIDHQIQVLVSRLSDLPADFVTASKSLNADIEALRTRHEKVMQALSLVETDSMASQESPTTMFMLLSKISHTSEDYFVLGLLMFLSIILEISILALTQKQSNVLGQSVIQSQDCPTTEATQNSLRTVDQPEGVKDHQEIHGTSPTASLEPPIKDMTPDEFLNAMRIPGSSILRGRDATAQQLGVPSYQAKRLIRTLLETGKIRVIGKRLEAHPDGMSQVSQTSHESSVS